MPFRTSKLLLFLSTFVFILFGQNGYTSAQSHMRPTFGHHQFFQPIQPTSGLQMNQNRQLQPQNQHLPQQQTQSISNQQEAQQLASTASSEPQVALEARATTLGAQQEKNETLPTPATPEESSHPGSGTRQLSGLMDRIRNDINTLVHHQTNQTASATPSNNLQESGEVERNKLNQANSANSNGVAAADQDDDDDDDDLGADDDDADDDDDDDDDDQQTAVIESEDGTRQVRDFFGNKIQMRGNSTMIIPGKSKRRDFGLLGLKAFLLGPVIGLTIKGALIKGMIWAVGMWLLHLLVPGLLTTLGLGTGLVGFARQLRPDYAQLLLANLASLPESVQHNLPPSVQKLANQYKQVFAPVIESIQAIPEGPCRLRAVCETASHLIRHTQFMSNSLQRLSATLYLNFGTEYSKAWLDGIVSSDCGFKYAACPNSPISVVAGKFKLTQLA